MSIKKTLVLLPVAALLIGACTTATSDSTTRDDDGVVIEGGDVGVLALNVGDCFDDPPGLADAEGATEILSVAAMPCSEPHDNQAFAKFELAGGDWPGEDAVSQDGFDGCVERFEAAVGEPYETSPLAVLPITPIEAGWDQDDREVLCAVYNVDLSKLSSDELNS